jgi:hypothetical protein
MPFRPTRQWLARLVVPAGLLLVLTIAGLPATAPAASGIPPATREAPVWRWPLPGVPPVFRRFGPPPTPYSSGHRGVDLGASIGTPVLAAGAGVVSFAAVLAGRGVLTVVHAGGLRTTYEPVVTAMRVGRVVRPGEQVGWLGAPTAHCGVGVSCLHWGLLRGSQYLDPLSLLGGAAVRLYPRTGAALIRSAPDEGLAAVQSHTATGGTTTAGPTHPAGGSGTAGGRPGAAGAAAALATVTAMTMVLRRR